MMGARLYVLGGRDAGRSFELDPARETLIGRDAVCGIRLADRSISRHHARLVFEGGSWELTDLDSRNGLVRNSVRVPHTLLEDGDEVCLGEVPIRFRELAQLEPVSVPPLRPGDSGPEFEAQASPEIEFDEEIELEETLPARIPSRPALGAPRPSNSADELSIEETEEHDSAARARMLPISRPPAPGSSGAPPASGAQRAAGQRAELRDRYAQALGKRPKAGWVRGDLSQLPWGWRALLWIALLGFGAAIFFLAFRGMQFLRG